MENDYLTHLKEEEEMYNMIIVGAKGSGKSTLHKALWSLADHEGSNYVTNPSANGGIDYITIRCAVSR